MSGTTKTMLLASVLAVLGWTVLTVAFALVTAYGWGGGAATVLYIISSTLIGQGSVIAAIEVGQGRGWNPFWDR